MIFEPLESSRLMSSFSRLPESLFQSVDMCDKKIVIKTLDVNHNYFTVGGIPHICFKQWFQITADAHPGVSGVSKDQKFCEEFKNTHCHVDHPAKN